MYSMSLRKTFGFATVLISKTYWRERRDFKLTTHVDYSQEIA
jgi:hypothetical protein